MAELSSEILERQFGPTEVEVLHQDERTRLICTRVIATGQILEVSSVSFIEAGALVFPEVHQAVLAGESMGKAFLEAGVEFARDVQATQRQNLPVEMIRQFEAEGPVTIVEVTILVGPDQTPYAEIIETYSPAVDWPSVM